MYNAFVCNCNFGECKTFRSEMDTQVYLRRGKATYILRAYRQNVANDQLDCGRDWQMDAVVAVRVYRDRWSCGWLLVVRHWGREGAWCTTDFDVYVNKYTEKSLKNTAPGHNEFVCKEKRLEWCGQWVGIHGSGNTFAFFCFCVDLNMLLWSYMTHWN